MKIVSGIARFFGRMLKPGTPKLDSSRLTGIYMSQANGRDGYSSDQQQNRTRRNGKYSHTRERA